MHSVYPYTAGLLKIGKCVKQTKQDMLPPELQSIVTPFKLREWSRELSQHPDKSYANYICEGIRDGFRIGYDYSHECKSARGNMVSTMSNAEIVEEYLTKELQAGRVARVADPKLAKTAQISPFGVIEKKNAPGKWRLIVDLSSPENSSVNDGISKELSSLSYMSVDTVAEAAAKLGKGALLAKTDVKSAYRNVPVHPSDRLLLGMSWRGSVYVDKALPFGLRSAPKIFTAVADALEWVAKRWGADPLYHFLDDYITLGPAESDECQKNLDTLLSVCAMLGVPVAVEKTEGPSTRITFLGIEVDTIAMELRLPQDKFDRLVERIRAWRGRKCCTKRELLSLIGH